MDKEFHTQNGRDAAQQGKIDTAQLERADREKGWGYLIANVINVTNGPASQRNLRTGLHTCEDIYCVGCNVVLGWEYKDAFEKQQKYKVGNFVLEEIKIMRYNWETN